MNHSLVALLKIAGGPFVFALVYVTAPDALSYNCQVALATFAWAVVWWVGQPIPWAITSMLPLVLFPLLGVMPIGPTAALFGQNIFFWIMGTVMLGYAMEKHGLARRISLWFLSFRGVSTTTYRLAFMYMLGTGCISMFVSDAATVAMMIPIGMSLVGYLNQLRGGTALGSRSALASFFAYGSLVASQAGGMGTIVGKPHNPLAVALASSLTHQEIGWFEWMRIGFPLFLIMLVVYYWMLRYFYPPEFSTIPGGEAFIRSEVAKIGKVTRGERNVLFTFAVMVILFVMPSMLSLALGDQHPLATAVTAALPIWIVPPIVLFLLFMLPVDTKTGECTLVWKDAVEHSPWNIMILCAGAIAMTDALTKFGFMDYMKDVVQHIGVGWAAFPYVVALVVGVSTNFVSGLAATSLFCSIFLPMAQSIGFNPALTAQLIANLGLGIITPWAGAAAGTAFATGYLDMREMIKVGTVATLLLVVIAASLELVFFSLGM